MEQNNREFEEIIEYYYSQYKKLNQELLVELLREIQGIYGFLPEIAQDRISLTFDIKKTLITSLIKLYPSLKQANYRHKITVCCGGSCLSNSKKPLLTVLQEKLHIKKNEITADGRFLLTSQNCLKKCKFGPNLQIDDDIYSHLSAEDLEKILQKYN